MIICMQSNYGGKPSSYTKMEGSIFFRFNESGDILYTPGDTKANRIIVHFVKRETPEGGIQILEEKVKEIKLLKK